jgi:hypothetical protein
MNRFAVDAKLNVLRAGDVLTEAGPIRLPHSLPMFPLCMANGLEQRLGGEGWPNSDGVDLFPSGRSIGGIRLCAYKEDGEDVLCPGPYILPF